jgi:hypothetical protein
VARNKEKYIVRRWYERHKRPTIVVSSHSSMAKAILAVFKLRIAGTTVPLCITRENHLNVVRGPSWDE